MKKRIIALLGLGAILLSSCSASAKSLADCKALYEGKDYSGYHANDFKVETPEDSLVKEGEGTAADDLYSDYLVTVTEVKLHTVHNLITEILFTANNANFAARC